MDCFQLLFLSCCIQNCTKYSYYRWISFRKCSYLWIPQYTPLFLAISCHILLLFTFQLIVTVETYLYKTLYNQPFPSLYLKCDFSEIPPLFFLIYICWIIHYFLPSVFSNISESLEHIFFNCYLFNVTYLTKFKFK